MPEQQAGVTLIVVGLLFILLGLFLPFFGILCAAGLLILFIGVVLAALQPGRAAYYPGLGAPAAAPWTYACPVCGQPLTWVPQYGRWWCGNCQAYR